MAAGIIAGCDPGIVAAWIKRADRRPQGWDLNLGLARHDLDAAAAGVLEHRLPGLGVRPAAATRPGAGGRAGGVQSPHPVATGSEAVIAGPGGVQQMHPRAGTGCNLRRHGVQRLHPNRPRNHPGNSPPPARTAPPAAAAAAGGGGPAGEFFAALDGDWQLTAAQRARLARRDRGAERGLDALALAGFTEANTGGVRNPYAVLASRLAPAELPRPIRATVASPRPRTAALSGS